MTDHPPAAARSWPPLVVASSVPAWIRARDFGLTLLMWALFAIMLETEFELFFGHYLRRLGLVDLESEANWLEFFQALLPFVLIALVLVLLLIVAALFSLRRTAISRRMPQPESLTIAEETARVGMTETELAAAREMRVVVVHIDPDGRHRVKAHGQAATEARTD
jgi:poly-beta-1,6-N-acetyl-D-glucosamine biosynthesis protein PgaD